MAHDSIQLTETSKMRLFTFNTFHLNKNHEEEEFTLLVLLFFTPKGHLGGEGSNNVARKVGDIMISLHNLLYLTKEILSKKSDAEAECD